MTLARGHAPSWCGKNHAAPFLGNVGVHCTNGVHDVYPLHQRGARAAPLGFSRNFENLAKMVPFLAIFDKFFEFLATFCHF